jgi:flagellar assembly protein FliH
LSKILKFEDSRPHQASIGRPRFDTFAVDAGQPGWHQPGRAVDLQASAEGLMQEARLQAAMIVDKARCEAQQVREEARQLGHEEGRREGAREIEAKMSSALQSVSDLLVETQQARDEILGSMESQIVGLVLAVADRIIREQASVDHGVALRAVQEAIEQVGTRDLIKISVNPDDLEVLESYWADTYGERFREQGLELAGDPKIEAGGCVVATKTAVIDTRIGVQLAAVTKAFMRGVEGK